MRLYIYFILSWLLFSCNDGQTDNDVNSKVVKDSLPVKKQVLNRNGLISDERLELIFDTLSKLPMMISSDSSINDASKGMRHISIMPDGKVNNEGWLYIAAGDNRPERFEKFYNFLVDTSTLAVRVIDIVNDNTVDVDTYINRYK